MASDDRAATAARIRELMATEGDAVAANTRGFNDGRYAAVRRLEDYEELKAEARAIKADAIERLPELVEQVREAVEANGGTVYVADDADDANRYVREVCEGREAELVVKSKSMTTEELEVNDALFDAGIEVVETDLGEWVLQVAEESPSHIVAPAIHRSRAAIAELFNDRFADDLDEPLETAEELTAFARARLGERIAAADVGVTGANFVTADSGTVALVTSEGNARKCIAATDTHVAVTGVEKVVPTVEDLQPFVELIGRSGTGQDVTSYVSLFTPPTDSPVVDAAGDGDAADVEDGDAADVGDGDAAGDGDPAVRDAGGGDLAAADVALADQRADRAFHLVLVDNGRMAMRDDDHLRETLYCIRCGACSNVCANFQQVGGHAFGGETYSGGIATGWEAGIEGLDTAAGFNDLCTGCSRCVDACPVGIDIPWINAVVRDRVNRQGGSPAPWLVEGLTPDAEPGGLDRQKRFFGSFATVARLGSATAPVSNWLARREPTRWLADRLLGVDPRRDLPEFERQTLVDWFRERDEGQGAPGTPTGDPEREAALYPDVYTNHVAVERGKAAVRVLEALGVEVHVPAVAESGRAPLSQGMVATAEARARAVLDDLGPHLDAGRDVVVIEPSDLAMFDRDYRNLLPADEHERLADSAYEVLEYVYGLLENGADASALRAAHDGHAGVAYHSHCQQRTLSVAAHTEAVLSDLGYDVVTSDVECCGMAGSFGYKTEYYELSMAVGEQLREQFLAPAVAGREVVASGTSCVEQLDALLRRPAKHPVELIAPP